MKFLKCIVLLTFLSYMFMQSPDNVTLSQNIYKGDPKVKHALFQENIEWNRVSADTLGVPPLKKENEMKKFPNPDSYVAYKIAVYYKSVFDFLDEDVNDELKEEDIEKGYKKYNWVLPHGENLEEFVKTKIKEFDANKDGTLNFVEFCHYLEDLWNVAKIERERKCQSGIKKAIAVYEKVFEFLDQDKDGKISKENVIYGISYIMNKDINEEDVTAVFGKYDKNKDNLLEKDEFVLAMANGKLLKSVEDSSILDSFLEEE